MRRISTLFLIAAFVASSTVVAGPIREAYYEAKEAKKNEQQTEENRKKQLLDTLNKALKRALLRYHNYDKYEKGSKLLTMDDVEHAKEEGYTYYFKYKDFVGYFTFTNNPEQYYSMPTKERVILEPNASIEDAKNNKQDEGNNGPANPQN